MSTFTIGTRACRASICVHLMPQMKKRTTIGRAESANQNGSAVIAMPQTRRGSSEAIVQASAASPATISRTRNKRRRDRVKGPRPLPDRGACASIRS